MRFYIASGLENAQNVRVAARTLTELGHVHAYDWTRHGDVRSEGGERLAEVAAAELAAVTSSELVLVMLPGGCGTHTELGAALAAPGDRQVWIYGDESFFASGGSTCAFYFHPRVRRFSGGFSLVLAAISEEFGGRV